jgi:hypothetical protein
MEDFGPGNNGDALLVDPLPEDDSFVDFGRLHISLHLQAEDIQVGSSSSIVCSYMSHQQ